MSAIQITLNQFNHCPFLVLSKTHELNYTYYNDAFKLLKNDYIGEDDTQMPWSAVAEIYQSNDKFAMENGFYQGIEPMPIGNEIKVCVVQKSVIRNQHNEVTGIIGFAHLATNTLSSYITERPKFPLAAKLAKQWFNGISMREFETLYYLVRGHTATEIAEHLDLSKRTVESYLKSARKRFGATNKTELINHLIQKGFASFIPQSQTH